MGFNFNPYDFHQLRQEAELFYDAIGKVLCPYFHEEISFNAKGMKHLKFKSERQARPQSDQYARIRLVHKVPEILKLSHTVQGIWITKKFEQQKTNSRWESVLKVVTFYEFIAVLDKVRIKVIVKQVEGGEKHFWSVIPAWGIDKVNRHRILHTGNPEQD